MDEVDGMSAGDRGGVVALKALIRKTQVGLLLSCLFLAYSWIRYPSFV
jgi:replication factor C subunit 1